MSHDNHEFSKSSHPSTHGFRIKGAASQPTDASRILSGKVR
jgi:hypothetical protein